MKTAKIYLALLLVMLAASASAQIHGVVTDAATGDTLLYPSVSYKGQHVAVSGNALGQYSIEKPVSYTHLTLPTKRIV